MGEVRESEGWVVQVERWQEPDRGGLCKSCCNLGLYSAESSMAFSSRGAWLAVHFRKITQCWCREWMGENRRSSDWSKRCTFNHPVESYWGPVQSADQYFSDKICRIPWHKSLEGKYISRGLGSSPKLHQTVQSHTGQSVSLWWRKRGGGQGDESVTWELFARPMF